MKGIKDPVEELKEFHNTLSGGLDVLEKALERFRRDGKRDNMRVALDAFFLLAKEGLALHVRDGEEALFPVLRKRRYPGAAINRLLNDHKDAFASI